MPGHTLTVPPSGLLSTADWMLRLADALPAQLAGPARPSSSTHRTAPAAEADPPRTAASAAARTVAAAMRYRGRWIMESPTWTMPVPCALGGVPPAVGPVIPGRSRGREWVHGRHPVAEP